MSEVEDNNPDWEKFLNIRERLDRIVQNFGLSTVQFIIVPGETPDGPHGCHALFQIVDEEKAFSDNPVEEATFEDALAQREVDYKFRQIMQGDEVDAAVKDLLDMARDDEDE